MWDETAGPLWGERGLLGTTPEWMQRALGLSDALITDLLAWMEDMTVLAFGPRWADPSEQAVRLDERGESLAARLQGEVGDRYTVRYHG
jgi:hypothetical protein